MWIKHYSCQILIQVESDAEAHNQCKFVVSKEEPTSNNVKKNTLFRKSNCDRQNKKQGSKLHKFVRTLQVLHSSTVG